MTETGRRFLLFSSCQKSWQHCQHLAETETVFLRWQGHTQTAHSRWFVLKKNMSKFKLAAHIKRKKKKDKLLINYCHSYFLFFLLSQEMMLNSSWDSVTLGDFSTGMKTQYLNDDVTWPRSRVTLTWKVKHQPNSGNSYMLCSFTNYYFIYEKTWD